MQTPLMSGVFWEQLANSGLLLPEQIASIVDELKKDKVSTETKAADYFVRRGMLTRYQADRLLEGRSRGFFFDNFRVLDLLGAGGMGWVYRAEDAITGEVVAIKVLLDRLKEDRGMLARFQQEARAGLLLNHPNVVRTRTTGSAGGMVYMVLDFVEGPSLLEILVKRRRLPWALACDFARQAALGLHHAHQFGLVHRDVKPQNLLINRMGEVKLLDFGLAMVREGEGGDEFSMAMIFGHECIGTPAFMAPEQASDGLAADARSDVYGLGCTLFGALVGETPFPLRNPHDVIEAHKTQPAPSVCDYGVKIPREVGEIVAKMLAKRPEDRYQTAAEAADALAKWSKSGPIDFNFSKILSERYRNAQERVGELHKSRPVMSGSASSTTRLSKLSSVARTSDDQGTAGDRSARSPREAGIGNATQRRQPVVIDRQKPKTVSNDPLQMGVALYLGKVLSPQGGSAPISLIQDRIVIGRGKECDVQIPDSAVSSRHCELYFDGVTWWITDLKSRNGVMVNGKPVNRRQLVDHDTISVANCVRLRFHDADEKPTEQGEATSKSHVTGLAAILIGLLIVYAIGFAMRLW